jgi:hypothetical protein
MFGSLICMSSDYFHNECLIGTTISELDKEKLSKNSLLVNFKLNDQFANENELKFDANTLEIKTQSSKIPKFHQRFFLLYK